MGAALANGIAAVLDMVLNMVQLLVIASVIIGWVGADLNNPIVRIIQNTTEPIYRPFRKISQKLPGPLDWAPVIVLMLIVFLHASVIRYLRSLAH